MPLSIRFEEITDPGRLEARWRAVESEAQPSFFLRWTWMGCWLRALRTAGFGLPQLLAIERDGRDVALSLIGKGQISRKLGRVDALWFNESGQPEADRAFIEYNGLLCHVGEEAEAAHAFCEALARRRDWRAFHLSGIESHSALLEVPGVRRRLIRTISPVHYVDLQAVRTRGGDYLSLLSANARGQLIRSLKEEAVEPIVEITAVPMIANGWLDEMRQLNAGRHADNAWDSAFFCDFARRIVTAGMGDGSVELLRIVNETEPLGYLLNFLWAGQVMNYQSAFVGPRSAKSKPGLMCHAAAVGHYAARGLRRYSFLAGADRYKQSLSTGAEELQWWTLERFDWRLEAEALARRMLQRRACG